jgi:hypothetical protein
MSTASSLRWWLVAFNDCDVLLTLSRTQEPAGLERRSAGGEQWAERPASAHEHLGSQPGGTHAFLRYLKPAHRRVDDEQRPARPQVRWSGGDQPVEKRPPVTPALPRAGQSPHRSLDLVPRQVRGIRGDEVKTLASYRREEITASGVHPDTIQDRVESSGEYCPARDVDGDDACSASPRGTHRDNAAARANIEHMRASADGSAHRTRQEPGVTTGPEHAGRDE